ncbi:bifunctional folylpolyglutamate synthase/dihydrofolate synthase [Limnovirga soli]|uniref:Dihydrofolate synthase/folylpolyglutamate synthase n=1 Tax=Limnovirga soli TaxID=2656915 RepID=A0A8J8FE59_9BACT|nr:folylpolyglutamate synthase/dihydrofolate synthase family protein [Limnovirga soli]NNV55842.1 bifunctional folylpolyglutamate synthase/dihydrofolate synthase [Limnovirga soli]
MTYEETIAYLYNALPMFSRIGAAAYKKDLTNTLLLCEALGNPQNHFRSIHIAGTNGKGSTSHMLAAVLQTAGYKTGLYTSPHLKDFRERIKINGAMCSKQFVIEFVEKIQPLIATVQPSFFEITVAMAFSWFAQEKIDIAIIEVGLGGRLDSTNIIQPLLSIITNIGWDHMNMLGDSLEKIAAEKAGIIKPNTPVIIGEYLPETKPVFSNVAASNNAPLIFASELFYVSDWQYQHHKLEITITNVHTNEHVNYQLDLPGVYQTKNIIAVITAIQQLQQLGYSISHEQVFKGVGQTKQLTGLHGRWELINQHPTVILDVAHNVDGIKQITAQLELSNYHALHIVIGMVKDKEIDAVLALLPITAHYYFTKAQIPRALDEITLQEKAASYLLKGNAFADVNTALEAAITQAHKDDLILVCGSVFLVGEVNNLVLGN